MDMKLNPGVYNGSILNGFKHILLRNEYSKIL